MRLIKGLGIEAIAYRNALDGTDHVWHINPPKSTPAVKPY